MNYEEHNKQFSLSRGWHDTNNMDICSFKIYSSSLGTVHYLWEWPGRVKNDWASKKFRPEKTGYKFISAKNDRVPKKKIDNNT